VGVELTKEGVDLGIVTANPEAMVAFYRDLLGFEQEPDTPFPAPGGGVMHRLWCGRSLIKIVAPTQAPAARPAAGGPTGALGYRYWTISVSNIEEITSACKAAGRVVRMPVTEIRPGVSISMVEDPDGNWVEFLQASE
jgi:glyoxylase I family protein